MNTPPHSPSAGLQVLTSPGPAGIAVVRLFGPAAAGFVAAHLLLRRPLNTDARRRGRVVRATLLDDDGAALDDALLSIHADAPAWDVRLHLHGNPQLVRRCAALASSHGLARCRAAPADIWPHSHLLDAEAAAALPAMATLAGVRWLLAQPGRLRGALQDLHRADDIERVRAECRAIAGRRIVAGWFMRPLRIVFAGPPNAGKSTLVNALADRTVCVVSSRPGTTRDWVDVPGEMGGFPVLWIDTAGQFESADPLDAAAMQRTGELVAAADAVVALVDAGDPGAAAAFAAAHPGLEPACVAVNKADVHPAPATILSRLPDGWRARAVTLSARTGTAVDDLRTRLLAGLGRRREDLDAPAAWTDRQANLLMRAGSEEDRKVVQDMLLRLIAQPVDESAGCGEDFLPRGAGEG